MSRRLTPTLLILAALALAACGEAAPRAGGGGTVIADLEPLPAPADDGRR